MKMIKLIEKLGLVSVLALLTMSVACAHKEKPIFADNEALGSGESLDSVAPIETGEASVPAEEPVAATDEVTPQPAQADVAEAPVPLAPEPVALGDDTADQLLAAELPTEAPAAEVPNTEAPMTTTNDAAIVSPFEEAPKSPELVTPEVVASNELPQSSPSFDTNTLSNEPAPDFSAPTESPAASPTATEKTTTPAATKPHPLPGTPVTREGQALNRFYFLRSGDTPASLSRLFYGSEKSAAELETWNGEAKNWKPGNVIFYVSADQPDDREMRSFYQENATNGETYEVKAGDQLSTIASERLGHVGSWREIAAMNNLANPDLIEPGQKLVVFPATLTGIQQTAEVAVPEKTAEAQVAEAPTAVNNQTTQDPVALEKGPREEVAVAAQPLPAPPHENVDADADPFRPDAARELNEQYAAMEVAKPVVENFTVVGLVAGGSLLVLFFVLYRRARRRARAMDFLD